MLVIYTLKTQGWLGFQSGQAATVFVSALDGGHAWQALGLRPCQYLASIWTVSGQYLEPGIGGPSRVGGSLGIAGPIVLSFEVPPGDT